MKPSRIILLGASGSGRSSIGDALAQKLGWDFIEQENSISKAEGMDFADFVIASAPSSLQQLIEENALGLLTEECANTVLTLLPSASKSAAVLEKLSDICHKGDVVVLLEAPIATLAHRCGLDAPRSIALGRPRALFHKHVTQVNTAYLQLDPIVIETSGDQIEIPVTQILDHFALQ